MKIPVNPVALGAGLVAVAAAVGAVFYMQRGAHVELKGAILKVRTQAMDESSAVAIVDFRFVNPSNYPFVVREVQVWLEDKDGKRLEGMVVSESDARRLFQYYPLLGQKFNDSLRVRNKVAGRQSMDRMIAARFEIPDEKLQARRRLGVRIEDVDGPVSELVEFR
ncbi:MAG: hypothetical protein HYR60_09600 [Acidobacteria bacterium]|nr:hypothetical protein [Acidobacteriota bacterium]MBI3473075.1 hypothetical protein [Candidatus Solibacter usitatus]